MVMTLDGQPRAAIGSNGADDLGDDLEDEGPSDFLE